YDLGKKTFTPFPLPDQEKSGGVSGNIFKDSKGRMYVSGLNYFISFHPDSVHMDRTVPQIYFTDFQIFGSSFSHLLLNNKIVLPYYQNTISVAFAAPSYTFSTPIRFAYKLQGINSDWIQGDPSNIANYANLDGGDYVFMVKMTNGANGQAQIATLNITIIPPYWKRWWFYALCGILVSLMIWLVYRYRINELVKRQTIRNKIAQDLHDNMGSALSSISIYGRVAQIQNARNEKQRLQEVLEKITATSTDVITEMNDIVWTINPRNDSMEKIVQRMESYARPLASAENIQFEFTFDKELLGINLNMEKRKNFYLIFKEAFNNSVKYAGAGKIITHICVQRNRVIMEITDDGKGFDLDKTLKSTESQPGGNGLINMTMRASEMRGSCLVRSEPGKGSSITLEFPY
ncbi:MAG TPA: triple tyrosine motif-containing protein, partial [Chitinophagaceae bacterium]|nr:triple tyrosine motif-containing protein [Chitinophagaceae bacterium]